MIIPTGNMGMATTGGISRHLVLPSAGTLLVSTDMHGNFEDFCAMRDTFFCSLERDRNTRWAILGDSVHGPSGSFRRDRRTIYGFKDQSPEIVEAMIEVKQKYPGLVHYVLGNHDHGHVGGKHTSKFHPDEVEFLESRMPSVEIKAMRAFFRSALLLITAPCGALLAHGSPSEMLRNPAELDEISLDMSRNDKRRNELLETILWSYGQTEETTQKMLEGVSAHVGFDLTMLIHGHDIAEEGWFIEGGNQLCLGMFGTPRDKKCFAQLDLAARYSGVHAIREGVEIRRLYR